MLQVVPWTPTENEFQIERPESQGETLSSVRFVAPCMRDMYIYIYVLIVSSFNDTRTPKKSDYTLKIDVWFR